MATAVGPEIAIRSRSPMARGRYIETTEQATRGLAIGTDPRAVLERSVAWLELFHISALTWEYIHKHDIRSMEQLRAQATNIDQYIRAAFPDLSSAEQQLRSVMGELKAQDELLHTDWSLIDWSQLVRSFDAVVAECPIDELEDLGRKVDEPGFAHRARNAFDALRAFVRRHDAGRAEVMRIVGEQYRRGHIRLRDASRLLGMSSSDAAFELEQDGFNRAPSAITLTEEDRESTYQRLRDRRLHRSGAPNVDPDLVDRDVIASERIEGVDARAWIRRR